MTVVQDRGRFGYQQLGVSVSGAVDTNSLDIGNLLVGNEPDKAALEVMLGGLQIEFLRSTIFALTGANTYATLDGIPLSLQISYTAHAGSRLALGMVDGTTGLRAYIAIAGGVDASAVLGSRSTHIASELGGVDGRALAEGDVLSVGSPSSDATSGLMFATDEFIPGSTDLEIRVVLGPQDDEFSDAEIETFLGSTYEVTDQSNRQGLRLDGPVIESSSGRYDIVSDAVVTGSIQVPGDGKPIILLADRQTTGGYVKIATVATIELPKLGQAAPGAKITFKRISVNDSQQLLIERKERLTSGVLENSITLTSLQIDGVDIPVGVAEIGSVRVAELEGHVYPISIDEITPVE
jgi:biotin-dependent carboxylase-like uncharacterized protein